MAPIEWTRLSGEVVEELVSTLVNREFPRANLIRSSPGEGGIDVVVPLGDGTIDVYQVKKFSSNLTDGQKTQVKKSWNKFATYRDAEDLQVNSWLLTLPLNPTNENLKWLKDITTASHHPCEWRGLTFIEGLAAKFPDVVDYYIHNGQSRLKDFLDSLLAAQQLQPAPGDDAAGVVSPNQLMNYLDTIGAALDSDPHFRYLLSVGPQQPTLVVPAGSVASLTRSSDDPEALAVTVNIFPRFPGALKLRSIPGNVTITAEPNSELAAALVRFSKFGTPFSAPTGTVEGAIDLPGGLAHIFQGASLDVGDVQSNQPRYIVRIATVNGLGEVQAEAVMNMDAPTAGFGGSGFRAHGADQRSVFSLELTTDTTEGHSHFTLTLRELTGRYPSEVLSSLEFLASLGSSNGVRVGRQFGPLEDEQIDLGSLSSSFDQDEIGGLIAATKTLMGLQQLTTVQLTLPDLTKTPWTAIESWETARALLAGEVVDLTSDSQFTICLKDGQEPPTEPFAFAAHGSYSTVVGPDTVAVGAIVTHCANVSAQPDSATVHEDHLDCVVKASAGSRFTVRRSDAG